MRRRPGWEQLRVWHRRVATLERRLGHLEARAMVAGRRRDSAYDRAEIAALLWALPVLRAYIDEQARR